jgi:hypothetical protein
MVGERSLVRVLGSERVGKGVSAYLINRQRDGDADRRGGGGVEEGRGQGIGSLTSRRGRGERREGFSLLGCGGGADLPTMQPGHLFYLQVGELTPIMLGLRMNSYGK